MPLRQHPREISGVEFRRINGFQQTQNSYSIVVLREREFQDLGEVECARKSVRGSPNELKSNDWLTPQDIGDDSLCSSHCFFTSIHSHGCDLSQS